MVLTLTDYLQWTYFTPDWPDWYYMAYYEDDDGDPMTVDFILANDFSIRSIDIMGGPQAYLTGDVDGDGNVNMKDVLLLRKAIAGAVTLTDEQAKRADVDGDGSVNMKDILMLRKIIAGAA